MLDQAKFKTFKEYQKSLQSQAEFYSIQSLLGCSNWCMFYVLIGARERGKSYAVMDYCLRQWKKYGTPFVWIRLTKISVDKMLVGKHCDKFVDADLVRKYDLDLSKKGMQVYDHGKPMAKVLALSEMAKEKGVALYDNEYEGIYNIVCDEFQREPGEVKRFSILYNLTGTLENLVRSRKQGVRIFLIANLLEECSEVLANWNFIPEKFGRYKLKSKRAIIDYIPPSEKYLKRREGAVANLLMPDASNYTNNIKIDKTLIYNGTLKRPQTIIKFGKDPSDWFVLWDGMVISQYKQQKIRNVVAMKPYIDEVFIPEARDAVFLQYDNRYLRFQNLITQIKFQNCLELLKPRK